MACNLRVLKAIPIELYNRLVSEKIPQKEPTNAYTFREVQIGEGTNNSLEQFTNHSQNQSFPILQLLPIQQRAKARQLLEILTQTNKFSRNETGEIVINGSLVKTSNIVDLLSIATRAGKLRQIHVPGLQQFAIFIRQNNIPKYSLGREFNVKLEESAS